MKKIVLFVAAVLSFGVAQAQTGPRFGIKAGANYSNISGKELANENIYQNKLGFVGGVTANFDLSGDGFLSVQPELLFSQRGYQYRDEKFTRNNVEYKRKGDVNYNYLDLPVLLRINAGGLFFEGGPQASYLLGIKDNTEEQIGSGKFERSTKVEKDNLSELEIGYAAGLGYQAQNGLSLGLRYTGGINALAKEDSDELTNARHSAFQLTLGYVFGGR
ncbi:porin family protein [Rufibacter latericius]|uniref:PorT family protein n=1 Tax=Rufibacter latericius TaxID=2487040 RepID=A0A3M9MFG5_9BACT|nr:porin family protein [Rufibacter latericius]RNI23388.1 PorT family protein [Rufibacter latericius]